MWRGLAIAVFWFAGAMSASADERHRYLFAGLEAAEQAGDLAEAFRWTLQIAAHSKDPYWRYRIGSKYWHGRGVAADPEQAVAWFSSAAALGSDFAMLGLARAYFLGRGAERSAVRAMRWLAQAAERGMDRAQFELASHYLLSARAGDAALAEERIARGLEARAASARRLATTEPAKRNPIGAAYLAAGDAFACPYAAPANVPLGAHFWIRAAAEGYGPAWGRLHALARQPRRPAVFCRWWRP